MKNFSQMQTQDATLNNNAGTTTINHKATYQFAEEVTKT